MHLDTTTRGRKTDEALEIIGRLWAGEKLDYEGRHYKLTGAQIAPLPVQPDLPMWIGGSSDAAVRRTARYGTGWQAGPETGRRGRPCDSRDPRGGGGGGAGDRRRSLRCRVRVSLRRRWTIRGCAAWWTRIAPAPAAIRARRSPMGDAATIMTRLAEYVEAGASKFILRPAAQGDADMLAQTRMLVEEVLPQVAARWPRPVKRAA